MKSEKYGDKIEASSFSILSVIVPRSHLILSRCIFPIVPEISVFSCSLQFLLPALRTYSPTSPSAPFVSSNSRVLYFTLLFTSFPTSSPHHKNVDDKPLRSSAGMDYYLDTTMWTSPSANSPMIIEQEISFSPPCARFQLRYSAKRAVRLRTVKFI